MRSAHAARLWGIVAEPKFITALMGVVYALLILAGLAAWTRPPAVVPEAIGHLMAKIWSMTLVISGVVGVSGAIPGWYWLEKAGLIGSIFASLTYLLAVGSQTGASFDALSAAAFLIMLIIRWERIKGLTLDPTRKKYAG